MAYYLHIHLALLLCTAATSQGANIPLLRSPLLLYNRTTGNQHICPTVPHYPEHCVSALDAIYGYVDGSNIGNDLMRFCTDECLKPLEIYWKNVIHDEAMPIFMSSTLCKYSQRGYCAQQLIMSDPRHVLEEVDKDCIRKWCPLLCSSRKEDDREYLKCCASAIVNQTFPADQAIELYGVTPKSLRQIQKRQYDYCGQLMMRFQSDGKCLNIIEMIEFMIKLVHGDENLVNSQQNRDLVKEGLESYCPTDCFNIITSYYTACAGVDEAVQQLFLYKGLWCSKDGGDYCFVKGLKGMEDVKVSNFKFRIYCLAPEFFCPRESCKKAINEAKSALGCCCQNLFNIEQSPFRDIIPDFIVRFMECQIEVPQMCGTSCLQMNMFLLLLIMFLSVIITLYA